MGFRHRLALLTCLALAATGACRQGAAVRQGARLAEAEIAERGRRATGIVTSGTCRGSGFFVAPTLVLTNAHVLCAEAAEIRIGGTVLPASFVKIDDELDVALLRTDETSAAIAPLPLAGALGVREGDVLTAVGAPADAGEAITAVAGPVTRPLTAIWGILHVEADLPLSPGNSGGPLLDDRGRAVGVVSKRRMLDGRRWALAVPADYTADWLPAEVAVTSPGWPARVAAAARAAAPDLERFRGALRRPLLLGAHYMRHAPGPGGEDPPDHRPSLVIVVAAPAAVRNANLTAVSVRMTCGTRRPIEAQLEAWVPIDAPVERSSQNDVTQLRPFLAWARARSLAEGLVVTTGVAPPGVTGDCTDGRLVLVDGDAATDSVAIE